MSFEFSDKMLDMQAAMAKCKFEIGRRLIEALSEGIRCLNWSWLVQLERTMRYKAANRRGAVLTLMLVVISAAVK